MKKLTTLLFVCAAALLITQAAKAQNTPTFNPGDLLLGFYDASSTNDYIIDLGAATSFTSSVQFTFSGTNINADLNSAFGTTSWSTDSTLTYGVAGFTGTSSSVGNLFASRDVNSAAAKGLAASLTGTSAVAMSNIQGAFGSGSSAATATNALIQSVTAGNSWVTAQGATPQHTTANAGGTTQDFKLGTANVINATPGSLDALNIYELPQVNNGAATLLGTLSISPTGTITYTGSSFTAVPEPSSLSLIFLSAALLLFVLKRRNSLKA